MPTIENDEYSNIEINENENIIDDENENIVDNKKEISNVDILFEKLQKQFIDSNLILKTLHNNLKILQKEVEKELNKIRKNKKREKKPFIQQKPKHDFKVGENVRMDDGRSIGTIDKIEKGKAIINYGLFTTTVSLERLEFVKIKK